MGSSRTREARPWVRNSGLNHFSSHHRGMAMGAWDDSCAVWYFEMQKVAAIAHFHSLKCRKWWHLHTFSYFWYLQVLFLTTVTHLWLLCIAPGFVLNDSYSVFATFDASKCCFWRRLHTFGTVRVTKTCSKNLIENCARNTCPKNLITKMLPEWCQNHPKIILKSSQNHPKIILKSAYNHIQIILKSP